MEGACVNKGYIGRGEAGWEVQCWTSNFVLKRDLIGTTLST